MADDTVSSSDQFRIGVTVDADTRAFEANISAVENRTRLAADRIQLDMNRVRGSITGPWGSGFGNRLGSGNVFSGGGGGGPGFNFGSTPRGAITGGSLNIDQSGRASGLAIDSNELKVHASETENLTGKMKRLALVITASIAASELILRSGTATFEAMWHRGRLDQGSDVRRAEEQSALENSIYGVPLIGGFLKSDADYIRSGRRWLANSQEERDRFSDPDANVSGARAVFASEGDVNEATIRSGPALASRQAKMAHQKRIDEADRIESEHGHSYYVDTLRSNAELILKANNARIEQDNNLDLMRLGASEKSVRLKAIGLDLQAKLVDIDAQYNQEIALATGAQNSGRAKALEKLRDAEKFAAMIGSASGSGLSISAAALGPGTIDAIRLRAGANPGDQKSQEALYTIAQNTSRPPIPVAPRF